MTPRRLAPDDPALPFVQQRVAEAFPPGSGAPSAGLSLADLAAKVTAGPALVTERDGALVSPGWWSPSIPPRSSVPTNASGSHGFATAPAVWCCAARRDDGRSSRLRRVPSPARGI